MDDGDADAGNGTGHIDFRLLSTRDWGLARNARLAALRDAPQSFLPTEPHEFSWSDERWRRSCRTGRWAVARSDGDIVGLARLTEEDDGPHLGSVWTDPRHRRRGVASSLVRLLVNALGERDVFVWIIRPNPEALLLYMSLGFERMNVIQELRGIGRFEERFRLSGAPRMR